MKAKPLQDILQLIRDDLRDVGGELQRGAADVEIQRLQDRTQQELRSSLPSSYEELLRITDGLSWGGVTIYGTSESTIVGFPDRLISGFIEANIGFRNAAAHFENYLSFGSDGDSLLSYNIGSNCYEVLTLFMTPLNKFNAFEEMIRHTLTKQM